MKVYETEKIRNVVVLGHSGSGKSNLLEAVLYTNGFLKKISKPEDQIQMTSALNLLPVEWKEHKYNFIDTPGYFDFHSDVVAAMSAAAGSIIVVDGTDDLQVGTDKALEVTDDYNNPRLIFVNKIDSEKADYEKILSQLRDRYGKKIAPFHIPMGKDKDFKGFINIVDLFAKEYNGVDCVDVEIPEYMNNKINPIREMLMESVAESDEELMEKYFSQEAFTQDEIHMGLRKGVLQGDIIPVLCGSTAKNIGIHTLLDMVWDYMPSPVDLGYEHKNEKFSGFVFKTIVDPFVGKISYVKVCEGEILPEQEVYNINKEKKTKISKIYTMRGNEQIELEKAVAGDIIVLNKLSDTQTNDTLATSNSHKAFESINFPKPQIYLALEAEKKGEEEKISLALSKMIEQDPSITLTRDNGIKQTLLGGQGEIHLNHIKDQVEKKFGVKMLLKEPKVSYKETIKGKSDVQGKHKKQSGGHGQYGDVKIRFEHSNESFEFCEEIFGGSVPKNYIPAVEKGLRDALESGVLAGFPVTNVKAILYDGSYHDVDSSEMAFKIAANLAFKKGLKEAKPILLEPVMKMKIVVPDEYMGDIMGDISKRRGKILGMDATGNGKQIIWAEAPQAETFKYAIDLRSITQGRGFFEMDFERYDEVPNELANKIIEEKLSQKEKALV